MKKTLIVALMMVMMMAGANLAPADGWDPTSKASNLGSVVNSRHNLTTPYLPSNMNMSIGMNIYGVWTTNAIGELALGDVCVYCHTPHGANGTIDAPLWNRTNKGNTYTLYNIPLTSGQTPTQPGVSSLTCLSCHDGTVAVDSIINMPGPGLYSAAQQTSQNNAFLNTWSNTPDQSWFGGPHLKLKKWEASDGLYGTCLYCHTDNQPPYPSFEAFALSTDLTNDHPVGVQLPDTTIYDFNAPTATTAKLKFYDANSNGRADPSEIRFYNTGEGYEVECASCHDPHGVPSGGPGTNTLLRPSFLRVSNANSAVCLTCHNK